MSYTQDNLYESLKSFSAAELKEFARSLNLSVTKLPKGDQIKRIADYYYDIKKFQDYTYIKQLGHEGRDARTFLVRHNATQKEYALKLYNSKKSPERIRKEVELQNAAAARQLAPRIADYCIYGKYIVMDKLDETLYDVFYRQNGKLTDGQQSAVIKLFQKMDEAKIFHADPNPLNIMRRGKKWFLIDYGFSKFISESVRKKHSPAPNMRYMPLGLYLQLQKIYPGVDLPVFERYLK